MRAIFAVLITVATLSLAGCGGGSSSGGGSTPPPPTAPTVTAVTPAIAATGVAINTTITATFSEAMSATSLTTTTFTLSAAGGAAVTGTVAYDAATTKATFTPAGKLSNNVVYTATITTGATSSGGAALGAAYSWSFTTVAATVTTTATVDFGTQEQIVRGFGGSEAWSGVMPSTQISALYGTAGTDVGLTIMRLRIAPATWTSSSKTADTSQWTAELTNGKAAQDMGAIVFASPWTAPPSMKTNNSVNEGSVATASYADYADYLEAYVNYASGQGVNLYAISMQNEPDWNPCSSGGVDEGPTGKDCYESDLWTGAQMDAWVANNSSVLTTKLIMPEAFSFSAGLSDLTLNDPAAVGKVAIVGGHIYGAAPYYYTLAKTLNKDVWMTEHYINLASGSTQSMTDALTEAAEIHTSMTLAQYNAYVYWWMVNLSSTTTGLIDTSGNMSYIGAAVAQFSRFVRPGYYRYSATANPIAGVFISAYAGTGHQTIVAINNNPTATGVTFTIQNQSISSLTPYQTTSTGMVAAQSAVSVTGNQFTYTLPAQSIVTFTE